MHVIQMYSYEGQSYEIQSETRRRLLNDIINTPIPKDIVKFANKLFGLAQGLVTKKGCNLSASKLTIDVLKQLMQVGVMENEFLLRLFNEGRI